MVDAIVAKHVDARTKLGITRAQGGDAGAIGGLERAMHERQRCGDEHALASCAGRAHAGGRHSHNTQANHRDLNMIDAEVPETRESRPAVYCHRCQGAGLLSRESLRARPRTP